MKWEWRIILINSEKKWMMYLIWKHCGLINHTFGLINQHSYREIELGTFILDLQSKFAERVSMGCLFFSLTKKVRVCEKKKEGLCILITLITLINLLAVISQSIRISFPSLLRALWTERPRVGFFSCCWREWGRRNVLFFEIQTNYANISLIIPTNYQSITPSPSLSTRWLINNN